MTKIKILLICQKTAGDVFCVTSTIDGLKNKYPNSNLYVATEPQYFNILENNPQVTGLIEYDDSMMNYRNYVPFADNDSIFDMAFHVGALFSVFPFNWINGRHSSYMGEVQANTCNVKRGKLFINTPDISKFNLPDNYIVIQSTSGQAVKDYEKVQQIVDGIKNIPIVHIGTKKDKKLNSVIDLRSKTTYQEAASVIKGAKLLIGPDSLWMHVAAFNKTPACIWWGGTFKEAAIGPEYENIFCIEPPSRGLCNFSCHLHTCKQEEARVHPKCSNNINPHTILGKVGEILGTEHVKEPELITLSSYIILKDGIKYGFPFERCINNALSICEEVVVVDGGSTDGTYEKLQEMAKICEALDGGKLRVSQSKWDLNESGFIGKAKAHAATLCTGTHRIQLDADELLFEPFEGAIKGMIGRNDLDCVDLPVINFYSDSEHIRVEDNPWKFRVYRNDSNITHGAHAAARKFNAEKGCVEVDRNLSDHCEPIYEDKLEIVQHMPPLEAFQYIQAHLRFKADQTNENKQLYLQKIKEMEQGCPYVLHLSWMDLKRKENNGEFWDNSCYSEQNWHNTSKDLKERIQNNQDLIIPCDLFKESIYRIYSIIEDKNE